MEAGTVNRKMGPLKLWQWVLIGVVLGGGVYLYKRSHPSGVSNPEEVVGGTGTGAYGPIDPNTGIPYAFEPGGGGSSGGGTGGGSAGGGGGSEPGVPGSGGGGSGENKETTTTETKEPGPFAEGLLAKLEKIAEERLKTARKNALKARNEAKRARQKAAKEHRARVKAEHQHDKRARSTGGAAHQAQTHHSPPHPITRVGAGTPAKPGRARRNTKRRR